MSNSPPRLRTRAAKPSDQPGSAAIPRLRRQATEGATAQSLYTSSLGTDHQTGNVLTLGDKERRSGLYFLGRPGMGKSTLLVHLGLQDIEHGHGLFFLDPHEDAIRDILRRLPRSRKQDVLLFNVTDKTHSFGINLVACDDPTSLDARRDAYTKAYEVFHSLWQYEWGPWLQLIVANLIRALIENPGYTLAAAPKFLTEEDFRKKLVANIRFNPRVAAFWNDRFAAKRALEQDREVTAALTRIETLLTDTDVAHVIGQKKTTLNFSQIMKERKIVLVSFPANLPDDTKRFLGTILVRELLWAARARRGDRSQFCLFVDEFQNFVTPDFASIIRETRKFGIAPTLAQQFSLGEEHKGVNEAIDAMANMVVFQPTKADAERKAKEFADRPEPAWVEILQEESVEVLEEEQPKIDELEDGSIEPIMALSDKPFDHLIRAHSNTRVSQLSGTLRELANAIEMAQAETEQADIWTQKVSSERVFRHRPDGKDGIEYIATREQLLRGRQLIETLIADVQHGTIEYGSYKMVDRLAEIAEALRAYIGFAQGAVWKNESAVIDLSYDTFTRSGKQTIPRSKSASRAGWSDVLLDPETERYLPDMTKVVVSEVPESGQDDAAPGAVSVVNEMQRKFERARLLAHLQENEEERDEQVWTNDWAKERYEAHEANWHEYWEEVEVLQSKAWQLERRDDPGARQALEQAKCAKKERDEKRNDAGRLLNLYKKEVHVGPPQMIEEDFLAVPEGVAESTRREWQTKRRAVIQEFAPVARVEGRRLIDFLSRLAGLCLASSSPEQHIYVPSGQYRPGIHKQIHYTPRLTLPHPRLEQHHPQPSTAEKVAQKELDLLGLAPYTAAYKLLPSGGNPPVKGVLSTFELPKPYPYYIVHGLRRDIVAATHQHYSKPRIEIEEELKSPQDDGADGKPAGNQPSPVSEEREQKRTRRPRKGEV